MHGRSMFAQCTIPSTVKDRLLPLAGKELPILMCTGDVWVCVVNSSICKKGANHRFSYATFPMTRKIQSPQLAADRTTSDYSPLLPTGTPVSLYYHRKDYQNKCHGPSLFWFPSGIRTPILDWDESNVEVNPPTKLVLQVKIPLCDAGKYCNRWCARHVAHTSLSFVPLRGLFPKVILTPTFAPGSSTITFRGYPFRHSSLRCALYHKDQG